MTAADREAAARRARAQEIALWRWTLVEPAMDPALTARQRGQVVRDLASREHEGPDGRRKVSVSRRTLDRWVIARRDGGFEALAPCPRQCAPRTDREVVDLAVGLKMENPQRTAAQVRRVLAARLGWAQVPSERAIQRWLAARELNTRPDGNPPEAFGRFEASAVNEIWTADLMNGPRIGGRDCHLSVIIDDRSRFLTAARFVRRPDAVRFAGVFRAAIAHCGLPSTLYCDNGSCYADKSLQRTCAVLGVKLTHSQPGRPPLTGQPQPAEIVRHAGELGILDWKRNRYRTVVAMSNDLDSIRAAEVRPGRWELAGTAGLGLINDYLGYVADRGYSPRTVRAYAFDLLHFARWLAAERIGVEAVDIDALLRYLAANRAERRAGQHENVIPLARGSASGFAPATINRRMAAISGLFSFRSMRDPEVVNPVPMGAAARRAAAGERSGLLGHLAKPKPRSRLRVREPRRLPRGLDRTETAALLGSFRTDRDRAIAGLMLLSGLRSAEVLGLRVADVDIGGGWVRVTGKGDKERRVPLDPDVAGLIQSYLLAERPETASRALFVAAKGPHRGQPLTAAGLRRVFRYHREISGVPAGHPHALRHSFGTALAEAGVDLPVLQALMGHDHVDSSAAYIHLAPAHVRAAYDAARDRQRAWQEGR